MARAVQQEAVDRVTAEEVKRWMDRGEAVFFVDTRNPQAWSQSNEKLPGAIRIPADEVNRHSGEIPKSGQDRRIVTYCTCPNEASSARVAQELTRHGYRNVYPLYGGFDAWRRAGYPLEQK